MSSCNCKVCSDHRRWLGAIDPQTDEAKAAIDEILSRLAMAETDAAVAEAKLEGQWPGYEHVVPDTPLDQRPVFETACARCNKSVRSHRPFTAAVVYCSIECAD